MQRVADAEHDAADELRVHERGVHRAPDVGARHHPAQRHRARLRVDVDHDRARAARVRDLRDLERGARGQRLSAASSASVTRCEPDESTPPAYDTAALRHAHRVAARACPRR